MCAPSKILCHSLRSVSAWNITFAGYPYIYIWEWLHLKVCALHGKKNSDSAEHSFAIQAGSHHASLRRTMQVKPLLSNILISLVVGTLRCMRILLPPSLFPFQAFRCSRYNQNSILPIIFHLAPSQDCITQYSTLKIVVANRAKSKSFIWSVRTVCQMVFEIMDMCSVHGCPLVNIFRMSQCNTLHIAVSNCVISRDFKWKPVLTAPPTVDNCICMVET